MMAITERILLLLTICVSLAVLTHAQGARAGNVCLDQKTCGACLGAGPQCGWCSQETYGGKRCDITNTLKSKGCDESKVVSPPSDGVFTQDLPPSNAVDGKEAIQLSPQAMNLSIRPHEPYTFNVKFRQAENYPVDIYFVMDLSFSMKDDKDKLAELGEQLAEEMSTITKNFRLGFGSFIDKKTMPYVSTVPSSLIQPCDECAAPYGFKNQLNLTDDISQFRTRVGAAEISGNLDAPEGGFDAMMQAIVCKTQIGWRSFSRKMLLFSTDEKFHYAGDGMKDIGWRDQSRKMLLFSTDAGFHFAGDGKLGGIVKPNDGHCHLDSQGYYSESLNQDYPSISQLSNKVQEEDVNVIFAVTKNQFDVYDKLADFIEGSVVGVLANDSSNVVTLVRKNYELISGTVEMKARGGDDNMYVSFKTKCGGTELIETGKCDNVSIGQNIEYEVTVEVTECPSDATEWSKQVTISPVGLREELVINLEMMCECDCEQPQFEEVNSPKCNNSGTFECGACTCNEGYYGDMCECDPSTLTASDNDAACKMTNTSEVCEGKGECICGSCDCYPISKDPSQKYRGDFCECNDFSCDYFDNMICGGPTRGRCNCGICACNRGYTGDDCGCPVSQETCRASNNKICNDKGSCECGVCQCSREEKYRGPTCEDCPTCPGKCEENKECVQCTAFQTGPLSEADCTANCTHITVVETVEASELWRLCRARDDYDGCYFYFIYEYSGEQVHVQREKENDAWRKCRAKDEDGCFFYFSYEYLSDKVEAQKEKECPKPVNILAIVLGVIAAIVIIGLLLLLLWKIIVTLYDRREYAKFEKEVEKAKWDMAENPIFKPATSTYKNPMK